MTIRRVTDAETLAHLVTAAGDVERVGEISREQIEDFVSSPENIVLHDTATSACAVFEHEERGMYDIHWLCPGRGTARLVALKKMVDALFTTYGACGIYGYLSRDHRAARVIARWLGASFRGNYESAAGQSVALYTLTKAQHART